MLEPQHPAITEWGRRARDKIGHVPITIKPLDEIVTTWSEEIEQQYTLYKAFPETNNIPPLHVLTSETREVDRKTGDLTVNGRILQFGVLEPTFKYSQTAEDIVNDIAGVDHIGPGNMKRLFETELFNRTSTDDYLSLNGNRLTIGIEKGTITAESDIYQELEDWTKVEDIFAALADMDDYPLTRVKDDEYAYEFQIRISLNEIHSDMVVSPEPLVSAINDYHLGVFENKPAMALAHVLYKHWEDDQQVRQTDIADIIGVDPSTLSHHVSNAESLIRRAHYTADKYDTDD